MPSTRTNTKGGCNEIYVMDQSIEGKILELQAKKAALSKGPMVNLSQAEVPAARWAQMTCLFDL